MAPHHIFNCARFDALMESIVEELQYRGQSSSRFYVCSIEHANKLMQFVLKTSYFPRGIIAKNKLTQPDTESLILATLKRDIIYRNISSSILEMVYTYDCRVSEIAPSISSCTEINLSKKDKLRDRILHNICHAKSLVVNDTYFDRIKYIVLERCDITLGEFLHQIGNEKNSGKLLLCILFQIAHVLARIKEIYPGFQHRDLHTDNVVVKFDEKNKYCAKNRKFNHYLFNGYDYFVEHFGFFVKIIDFGMGTIPELGIDSVGATLDSFSSTNDMLLLIHGIYNIARYIPNGEHLIEVLDLLDPSFSYRKYYIANIDTVCSRTVADMTRILGEHFINLPKDAEILNKYN